MASTNANIQNHPHQLSLRLSGSRNEESPEGGLAAAGPASSSHPGGLQAAFGDGAAHGTPAAPGQFPFQVALRSGSHAADRVAEDGVVDAGIRAAETPPAAAHGTGGSFAFGDGSVRLDSSPADDHPWQVALVTTASTDPEAGRAAIKVFICPATPAAGHEFALATHYDSGVF